MKKNFYLLLFVLSLGIGFAQTPQKKLVVDELMTNHSLQPAKVEQLRWLKGKEACIYITNQAVLKYDLKTKKIETLITLEGLKEKLKDVEGENLSSFPPSHLSDENRVFFQYGQQNLIFNLNTKNIETWSSVPIGSENMEFSPDNLHATYTLKNNLYLLKDDIKLAISKDINPNITNGQAVHRNEFGITKGTFWSPKGNYLAFYRLDERNVNPYPITNFKDLNKTEIENTKYPFAGNPNPIVSIGIYDINTFETIFLNTSSFKEEFYLPCVTWCPSEKYIYAAVLSRQQKEMKLCRFDAKTGELVNILFEEKNDRYVEPENPLYFLPNRSDKFIWISRKDNNNHLYLFDSKGNFLKQLSSGNWDVTEFIGFNSTGEKAYIIGTKDSYLERHLYCVDLASGEVEKITKEAGVHKIKIHSSGKYFIDTYSNPETANCIQIIDTKGNCIKELIKEGNILADYTVGKTEIITLKAADNATTLYGRMIKPFDFDSTKKYPVFIYVYNGPHSQLITNSWLSGANLFLNFMAQEGYIVWTVDARGTSNRGMEFESCTHRNLGTIEIEDQMKGVEYLKSLPYVDATRLGVDGWSFGGFMSIGMKTRYPGVFKVASAGGPVIDWRWYEIMYTERYMESPENNPIGYDQSSLIKYIPQLEGKLLLIHGGMDDIVLLKHSMEFLNECVKQGKQIDFFLYPNHKHNVLGEDRNHLFRKIYEYYEENL